MKKRVISIFLCLVMLLGAVQMSASAASYDSAKGELHLGAVPQITASTDVEALNAKLKADISGLTNFKPIYTMYPYIFFNNGFHDTYFDKFDKTKTYYVYWVFETVGDYNIPEDFKVFCGDTQLPVITESKTIYTGYMVDKAAGLLWIMVELQWVEGATTSGLNSVEFYDFEMNYKKTYSLGPIVDADEGTKYTLSFASSDPSVVKIDNDGTVYGAKRGSADITVTATDDNGYSVQDTFNVKVKYSFGQWLIVILLFGWIWY